MKTSVSFFDIFRSEGTFKIKLIKLFDHTVGGILAWLLPPARPRNMDPALVKTILIIRPGGIGDAVFLLPILRALKDKRYSFDVLCEQRNSEVFASQQELCNKVIRYDVLIEFIQLFFKSYDVVIDTEQWHLLSAIVAYFIKCDFRQGFAVRHLRSKLFNSTREYGIDRYELENFLSLFSMFGISDELKVSGSYHIPDQDILWAVQKVPGRYIALALGGSISLRRFTKEQVLKIVRYCADRGFHVVLLGGKDVAGLAREICDASQGGILDFTGQMTLARTAAVIKHSWIFIGHDSGILHLACANAISVIALFGPGNEKKWGPRGIGDKVIYLNLDFSSCTRFGYTFAEKEWRFNPDVDRLLEAIPLQEEIQLRFDAHDHHKAK